MRFAHFLPDISAACQFVEGREQGETCRGEWTFRDVIDFSHSFFFFPCRAGCLCFFPFLFGKRKFSAFYLYTTPPILLPCIDFTRAAEPAMAVLTTRISLLFKYRVRAGAMTDGREIAKFCAYTQPVDDVSNAYDRKTFPSTLKPKSSAVNSLSKHRLSLVGPLTFWTYMDTQHCFSDHGHGLPISVYRHVGYRLYNVCYTSVRQPVWNKKVSGRKGKFSHYLSDLTKASR